MKPNTIKNIYMANKFTYIIKLLTNWGFSRKGLYTNKNGEWLLAIQLIILISHLLPSYPSDINANIIFTRVITNLGLLILSLGVIQSMKALIDLGASLTPLAEPKENSPLVVNGSFKNCRHPLYRSLLIVSIGITLLKLSLIHLILFITLCAVLTIKARREERSLISIHPIYKIYIKNTPAIIAGIKYLDWRR